jgi:Protein of unknown function (DUF3800)
MYVDEVGNSDLKASRLDENHRYLSLTGVIAELAYVADELHPRIEDLKSRYFGPHPDERVVLHRKDLVNQRPPFQCLLDPDIKKAFDAELLRLIEELEYVVITVVIDKLSHLTQYRSWVYDPYHYCLAVLMERFTMWLDGRKAVGDVMAESRGGNEDRRLKAEFRRIYMDGTLYVAHSAFVARLTSSELKVKPKLANVAGLQLADLIAHPSFIATKARRERAALPKNFGGRVAEILEATKYRRRGGFGATIEGYGRKWLP